MSTSNRSYQQFQPEDRVTLASLRQQGQGVRSIARTLCRSPSSISRELRRNAQGQPYGSLLPRHAVASDVGRHVPQSSWHPTAC